MNDNNAICDISFGKFVLKTAPHSRGCRYHRIQREEFTENHILPKGFCAHAYRGAYPYCLSLLYDGKYPSADGSKPKRSASIKCPSCNSSVEINIKIRYTLPYLIRKLKTAVVGILRLIRIPSEFPDKNIILEISDVKGKCPLGIEKGQTYLFNIWNRKELCPASFYAVYPVLMSRAVKSERTPNDSNISFHCPDPFGVHYGAENPSVKCEDFFSVKAEVTQEIGKCPRGHKKGDFFSLEDVLTKSFCPLAFYSIFPYYLTLIHSGRFEWLLDRENVKVQCPKVGGVIMEVSYISHGSLGSGIISVNIIGTKGICPKGYKEGDMFSFDSEQQPFCFKAIAALVPFKGLKDAGSREYACPSLKNFLSFKLT